MAGNTPRKSATKVASKSAAKKTAAPKTVAKKTAVKKSASTKTAARTPATKRPAAKKSTSGSARPALLSGGNPQIPKGYGDAPVRAYITAIPDWKRDIARRLDALVSRTVPDVYKAVKWNTPLYGVEGDGWFLAMHCFAKYLKVTFFRGTSLRPVPPVGSKTPQTRYLHIHKDDTFDEAQLADWIRQARALPGERM